jgi:crossover junction endodeoxyribonuclease RusA
MKIEFVVIGEPAPQGSKSYVGKTKEGRAILKESSKKVKPWRQDVADKASRMRTLIVGQVLHFDGPLRVSMVFTLKKPLSAPKRKRTWPDKKPDLSKLVRSTEDALVTAGLIADDARIVELTAQKIFLGEGDPPIEGCGARISIENIDESKSPITRLPG